MAKRHEIHFKHKTGSIKSIPGVSSHEVLAPTCRPDHSNPDGPVYKTIWDDVKKIRLVPEATDVRLLDSEKDRPEAVKAKILERRAGAADVAIQANEIIREALHSYEQSGDIDVLNWDVVVDESAKPEDGASFAELSPIALLDYADRGLTVPAHLQPSRVASAVAEANAEVKRAPQPKK